MKNVEDITINAKQVCFWVACAGRRAEGQTAEIMYNERMWMARQQQYVQERSLEGMKTCSMFWKGVQRM